MKNYIGIVLKTCSSHVPEMTVLDRHLGKIQGKAHARNKYMRASHGSIVTYTLTQRGVSYIFDIVDLEHVHFTSGSQDIFFLHHILELCYYFLPARCAMTDVFNLIVHFFHTESSEKVRVRRGLILVKLFLLFGMYPEGDMIADYTNMLIQQPLEELLDTPVDVQMNRWLDQWVWGCIMSHPYKEQFKTVWLLKRAESDET